MNGATSKEAQALAAAMLGLTEDQLRQKEFIESLCNNVRDAVIRKVRFMPPEWDGHELREYLAEQFARERMARMREDRKRMKAYRNAVYNLIR